MGTILRHDKLHPPSRNGDISSEDGVWLPMCWGNEKGDTSNPLTLGNALVNAQLHILADPPECSAGGALQQQLFMQSKNDFISQWKCLTAQAPD